jgi:hypothetical protein
LSDYAELLQTQLELLRAGKRFALVTVLSARSPSALKSWLQSHCGGGWLNPWLARRLVYDA